MNLILRFLIGGLFVSFFAALGDSFKPKSFAGLFGAAPSVALAGLILTWSDSGSNAAATAARSMIPGALALALYSFSCSLAVRRTSVPPWLSAGLLWVEWLAASFLLYGIAPV